MRFINNAFCALFLSLSILPAFAADITAADHFHAGRKFIASMDQNQDKQITREEFAQASKQRFVKMDSDSDGTVSETEFDAYIKHKQQDFAAEIMNEMDSNKDNKVSREEYVTAKVKVAEQRFKETDSNNDGFLSSDELGVGKKRRWHDVAFSRIDKNGDGKLNADESAAMQERWFQHLDKDGNNVIEVEELRSMRLFKRFGKQ